ncbi:MAG: DUF697 domain-containing protein [Saprospiraceae bacterium]|nr:DUF697 domain-containing protein [Saprospiraceae bacterium]
MKTNPTGEASHADTVIRNHVIWAMGSSFIPLLLVDILAVTAVQMDMIRQLCKIYNIDFKEQQGKAIISSLTTSTLSRVGARSLVKLIPVIGSIVGGVAVSVFAGASTYALGEVFKRHFESGGTILDFDVDNFKKYYDDKFEKGKTVAKEWKDEADAQRKDNPSSSATSNEPKAAANEKMDILSPDAISKVKELAKLKDDGIITDQEFQDLKKKVLGLS